MMLKKMLDLSGISLLALLGLLGVATAAPQNSKCSGEWTTLANLPEPRQEHSTVAVNDHTIAVVGGTTAVLNGTTEVGLATTDLVQLYDTKSNTWRTVAPTPFKVNHPNVAVHNGLIYLLGGLIDLPGSSSSGVNWYATGESHVYDPQTDSWSQLEPMQSGTERGSAIVGVYGDMIYLAGGMSILQSLYQDSLTMVTAFNTTSGKWQRVPPIAANIPEGRQHGVGAVVNGIFYLTGGRWFSQGATRGDVFMLDLNNQSTGWQTSAGHMPVPRGGLSGAVVGNQFFTFGGEGNANSDSGVFNETEAFDVKTQRWVELKPMAVPRHGTYAAAIGNKIYIPGGGLQQDGRVTTFDGSTRFLHTSDHFDVLTV